MSLPAHYDIYDRFLTTNRGSVLDVTLPFFDEAGDPANLFGLTVELFDLSPELMGRTTVTVLDSILGLLRLVITWDDDLWPAGDELTRRYNLRIRIVEDGVPYGSNILGIIYE